MDHHGLPPGFWKEFIIMMGAVLILLAVIPAILRRRMEADKKKWFSYNHINDFHKKGDWALRLIFTISLIAGLIIFTATPFTMFFISGLFLVSQLTFQAYVEWRFTENRKNYKVSLVEVGLTFIVFIGVFLWLD